MSDSIITPEARERCEECTPEEQVRLMKIVELALLEKRVRMIKQQLDHDQSDVETAFECDRIETGIPVTQQNQQLTGVLPNKASYRAHSCDIEGCAVCDPCYGL